MAGRVESVSAAWDPQVSSIYTYVSVVVLDVMKGTIGEGRIIVKQLGGTVGRAGLSVHDQATFEPGEEVLLFLESRPRDHSLYTVALWQGKWSLEVAVTGKESLVRRAPAGGGSEERHTLTEVRIRTRDARRHDAAGVNTRPVEAPDSSAGNGFTLLGPFRFGSSPLVDMQAGGQPGLAGGGVTEILSAIGRWNGAGSAFRFAIGTGNGPPRCYRETLGNGRVTISFMDPCGEISDAGGTLAIGGSYYSTDAFENFAGQTYYRATDGFIINNDSPAALSYLSKPGCFEDIQTHELGHVLGLNHSSDPAAIMYAVLNAGCVNATRGLGADDMAGVRFIYGPDSPPTVSPPSAPTSVRVGFNEATDVLVSWPAVIGLPPGSEVSGYRVNFRDGHRDSGPLIASFGAGSTSLQVAIPPGLGGAFNVTVTARNAAGEGPPSVRRDFTIPGDVVTCATAAAAVADVTGSVDGGVARLLWAASPDATSYRVQVGTTLASADLVALTDIGHRTVVSAFVSAGFRAWIRIYAANQCGVSNPVDFFLQ
jgi:hypothetical protein